MALRVAAAASTATRRRVAVDAAHLRLATADVHQAAHGVFTKKYARQRAQVDHRYHSNYTLERQALQDKILDRIVPQRLEFTCGANPWLVFSAGAMGSGKTTTLEWMHAQRFFPLQSFAFLDHDAVRGMLPEMEMYKHLIPDLAGQLTQQEAGFIIELATRRCIDMRMNCLVDGSLRDSKWYRHHIADLRAAVPHQRVGIIHVTADENEVRKRVAARAHTTGRRVPDATLRSSLEQVPKSVALLRDSVDVVATIDNSGTTAPRFDSLLYPKASRLPTGGLQLVSPPWQLLWANFTEDFRKDADDTPPAAVATLPEDAFGYSSSVTECHAHRGSAPPCDTTVPHRPKAQPCMDYGVSTPSALPEDRFSWCGSNSGDADCYAQVVSMSAI
eukprot:TRINITY_DN24702_c0_g1_i1.p1 TRINITY_DN24702_c0_g1~~TRINITY_DN24702_c0_g1_i1.p1  ORF type:complete len:388 (+),score=102.20 TRINITY_DN24702_c0_g1_i1:60-1223(+)